MNNTLGDVHTKYMSFEVRRCVNTTENGRWCKGDEEIDEYLSKASIEFWSLQKRVDMQKYHEAPLYEIMELEGKKLLNVDHIQTTIALLD